MEIAAPAIGYFLASVCGSATVYYFIRKPVTAVLVASFSIITILILTIDMIPWSVRHYIQDMIYEPLVIDIFHPISDTIFSLLFHIFLPMIVLVRFRNIIPERR